MEIIIAKFGGTSVSSPSNIGTICQIAKREKGKGLVIVVSALSQVTNLLLSLPGSSHKAQQEGIAKIRHTHALLTKDFFPEKSTQEKILSYMERQLSKLSLLLETKTVTNEVRDSVAAIGETLSSFLIAEALSQNGIPAQQVLTTDCIVTNDTFTSAEFLPGPTKAKIKKVIIPLLKKKIVPVVTGFMGVTTSGKTTTLGRGGSDYTASIIGYSLLAKEIQIWTDVDGIFSTDPKILKTAKLIKIISYREASELASFGVKVLHPRTLKPAISAKIPVRVLNTFNPKGRGTTVTEKPIAKNPVTAISFKRHVTLVNVYTIEMLHQKGFLAKVYKILAQNDISVDLVSSSEVSESIVFDNVDNLANAVAAISKFATVTVQKDLGMVSLIGEGVVAKSKAIKEIFEVLDKEKILVKMVSLGAIDINVSLVIKSQEVDNAVIALHNNFFKL